MWGDDIVKKRSNGVDTFLHEIATVLYESENRLSNCGDERYQSIHKQALINQTKIVFATANHVSGMVVERVRSDSESNNLRIQTTSLSGLLGHVDRYSGER